MKSEEIEDINCFEEEQAPLFYDANQILDMGQQCVG